MSCPRNIANRLLAGVLLFYQGLVPYAGPVLHSHNDYEHARPLFEALEQGFNSVEADIHLVEGELLVAHDRNRTRTDRTLQSLYLDPLRQRLKMRPGQVITNSKEFYLLIDIKSEAVATWRALETVLSDYADILTHFGQSEVEPRAVTVLISGNRPRDQLKSAPKRLAAMDGRLEDLESGESPNFIPLISSDWKGQFSWTGLGPMPADERRKLTSLVERAHAQKRMIRFWGTPDLPSVWRELREATVDFLNADDLRGLARFMKEGR